MRQAAPLCEAAELGRGWASHIQSALASRCHRCPSLPAGGEAGLAAGLMRVQLAALSGDAPQALALLKALPGVQDKPAVIATQAALMQQARLCNGCWFLLCSVLCCTLQRSCSGWAWGGRAVGKATLGCS